MLIGRLSVCRTSSCGTSEDAAVETREWYDVFVALFRERHERVISDVAAYARCYGDRGADLLRVTKRPLFELSQRRRGYHASVRGGKLREAFAAKLDERHA